MMVDAHHPTLSIRRLALLDLPTPTADLPATFYRRRRAESALNLALMRAKTENTPTRRSTAIAG